MSRHISRFNPLEMLEEDILLLATGRERLLETIITEMKFCLTGGGSQQFVIYGPRGMGKSFFTRLIQIHHKNDVAFKNTVFIQFPEEQNNVEFVADVLDMISVKLEGGYYQEVNPRWEITDSDWEQSKKRLKAAFEKLKIEGLHHVYFTMENLQDFIPKLDETESGRLREVFEQFDMLSMIGTSLRPDLDSDYTKKLFQVFKKIELRPWKEKDFLEYYTRKLKVSKPLLVDTDHDKLSQARIRAIAQFSGGSPRLAVILNSLIIEDDIVSTIDVLQGIVDELTPYYQDLTKDIPRQTSKLFDLLIRLGENVTQSQIAESLGKTQNTIARSFRWLIDNFYVSFIKQKKANVKHYFVRDRLYVLYYQNRQTKNDQVFSLVEAIAELLTQVYTPSQFLGKAEVLLVTNSDKAKALIRSYMEKQGWAIDSDWSNEKIVTELKSRAEIDKFRIFLELAKKGKVQELELRCEEENYFYHGFLAIAYYRNKRYKESIEFSKKQLQIDSEYAPIHLVLAQALFMQKKYTEAIRAYEVSFKQVPELKSEANLIIRYASCLFVDEHYEKAKSVVKVALKTNENNLQLNLLNGILEFSVSNYDFAIEIFMTIRQNYPDSTSVLKPLSQALANKGRDLYQNGKLDNAIDSLTESISVLDNFLSISLLCKIYFDKGDIELLLQQLRKVSDDQLPVVLAGCLVDYQNSWDRAKYFKNFKVMIDIVKQHFSAELTSFTSLYFRHLYELGFKQHIADALGEIVNRSDNLEVLNGVTSVWHYLIYPLRYDFESLHPDVRIAVKALQKELGEPNSNIDT